MEKREFPFLFSFRKKRKDKRKKKKKRKCKDRKKIGTKGEEGAREEKRRVVVNQSGGGNESRGGGGVVGRCEEKRERQRQRGVYRQGEVARNGKRIEQTEGCAQA